MTKIDPIDRKILQELSKDGRQSNTDLANRIGLSPSACLRRVQELERTGVIKGYRAILDAEQMGRSFIAYLAVGLSDHSKAGQKAFEQAMEAAPQVVECHNITGTVEYMLRVEVADLFAYKHLHTEIIGQLSQVSSLTSYIVLGSPVDRRA